MHQNQCISVSILGSARKIFPLFLMPMRPTLLLSSNCSRGRVGTKIAKNNTGTASQRLRDPGRSARLGKRLDPDLKSWLDEVIIPALVREYLAEIKKQNRLAAVGTSEVTSDVGR